MRGKFSLYGYCVPIILPIFAVAILERIAALFMNAACQGINAIQCDISINSDSERISLSSLISHALSI